MGDISFEIAKTTYFQQLEHSTDNNESCPNQAITGRLFISALIVWKNQENRQKKTFEYRKYR